MKDIDKNGIHYKKTKAEGGDSTTLAWQFVLQSVPVRASK